MEKTDKPESRVARFLGAAVGFLILFNVLTLAVWGTVVLVTALLRHG